MRPLPPLLLALALLVPLALAQPPEEPSSSPRLEVGPVAVFYNLTAPGGTAPYAPTAGEDVELHFVAFALGNGTYNVSVWRVLPPDAVAKATFPLDRVENLTSDAPAELRAPLAAPDEPTDRHAFQAIVQVEQAGTNMSWQETASVTTGVRAPDVAPPAGPLLPTWAWILLAAVLLLGGGVAVQRARRRQVKVAPRSRTLSELQVEQRAERARPRDAAEIEAERAAVEARERERLAQRENSILEAKRQDLLKSIRLMEERHARGEITAFQLQKLKEKKEQQLADLERQGGGT